MAHDGGRCQKISSRKYHPTTIATHCVCYYIQCMCININAYYIFIYKHANLVIFNNIYYANDWKYSCHYQSVFWSSITNKVKQRSLLYASCVWVCCSCCCCCCCCCERPTPVKLDTRCSRLSRDFAGDVGALVVRLLGLNGSDKSALLPDFCTWFQNKKKLNN